MIVVKRSILSIVFIMTLSVATMWAGGIALYEIGTPYTGTASAGWAAAALDASTAFTNPAGMARLKHSQLLLGGQPLIVLTEFDDGSGTTVTGGSGGNAGGVLPSLGMYYVHDLHPKLKIGATLNSYMGGSLDYDDDWAGRYYTQKAILLTFNINPSVAWRISDWLSVGWGMRILYGTLDQQAAINNISDELEDGTLKLKDGEVGFGSDFGALFEPVAGTRLGVVFRSKTDLNFEDVAEISGLGPGLTAALELTGLVGSNVNMELTVPQEIMVSGYHEINDKYAVLGNFGWQKWETFGKSEITIESDSTTDFRSDRLFDNTWHFAGGLHYRYSEPVTLLFGFAYDTSPVSDENRTADLPVDRQIRYAGGLQYKFSESITFGGAYTFADLGNAEINQTRGPLTGTLEGRYETNQLHVINFHVIWSYL